MARAKTEFGRWLDDQLEDRALDIPRLAERMGVSPHAIYKARSGHRSLTDANRAKLAAVFDISTEAIPPSMAPRGPLDDSRAGAVHARAEPAPTTFYCVRDGVPDHCMLQLAEADGKLAGFELLEPPGIDPLQRYPGLQLSCLELALRHDVPALFACADKHIGELEESCGCVLHKILHTDDYHGYALVTLASKRITPATRSLDESPAEGPSSHPTRRFNALMSELRGAGVISSDGSRDRTACLTSEEDEFIRLLCRLHDEMDRGVPDSVVETDDHLEDREDILTHLDLIGTDARDVVVGDAYHLALALDPASRYKALLTFRDVEFAIQFARSDKMIRKNIRPDFESHWLGKLEELKTSVSWYMLPDSELSVGGAEFEATLEALRSAGTQTIKSLLDPHARVGALRLLHRCIFESPTRRRGERASEAAFARAWGICFDLALPRDGRGAGNP